MKDFKTPEIQKIHFDVTDILTASGESSGDYPPPINPELPPDDDFE